MKENDNKEINLLQLISLFFDWIIRISKSIVNFVGKLFQLSFRHLALTLAIIVISLSVSIYLTRAGAKIYKAEALAMIYGPEAQTVREVSKLLENTSPESKSTSLATLLSLPDSVTKNIVGFHSYTVIGYLKDRVEVKVDYSDDYPQKDTMYIKMTDRVQMQLLTKNIRQVPQIQKAILSYFNNNNVLKNQFEARKNEHLQRIKICEMEIHRIDSLAKVSYFKDNNQQMRFDNQKLIVGEQKKQLFSDELLRLNQEKYGSEYYLSNFNQPVQLPSNFVVNPTPVNGTVKYAAISILIGFIISLVISMLIENYKKAISYLKSRS
ncbi:MAG: hypothetical protein PHW73_15235 [Atribacterota bacterium]|nr:hypothetical protein [Atribacterota bacterium]